MRQIDWSSVDQLMEDLRVLQEKYNTEILAKRQEIASILGPLTEAEREKTFGNVVCNYEDYSAKEYARECVSDFDDLDWIQQYYDMYRGEQVSQCEDEFTGLASPEDSPEKMGEIAKEIASRHPGIKANRYGDNWFFDYD